MLRLNLRTSHGDGSVDDLLWNVWDFGDEATPLDKHRDALRRPDVPQHDLDVVAW